MCFFSSVPDFKPPPPPAAAPPPPVENTKRVSRNRPTAAKSNGAFSLRIPRNQGTGIKL